MADRGADTDEATEVVRWLLESGVRGLGLTKTHAPQRATVREAAARWPRWWNHELFGPPHREAELPVLEATHAGLRRMRLARRQRETLHTTARGRQLLAPRSEPLTLELTAAGHRLAATDPSQEATVLAAPGDAALVFDADLLNARGVRARLAVLERQPLTALHDAIQQAFGWWDDHLYSWRIAAEAGDHPRVLELRGTPPPQYPATTTDTLARSGARIAT